MRLAGINVAAVAVAAIAIYAIGFIIYGLLFASAWQSLTGYDPADYVGLEWRMALSPIMPILTAAGVALALKWRNVSGVAAGLSTALLLWLGFVLPARMYTFAYSAEPPALFALDAAHLLLGCLAAGAILGAWPQSTGDRKSGAPHLA